MSFIPAASVGNGFTNPLSSNLRPTARSFVPKSSKLGGAQAQSDFLTRLPLEIRWKIYRLSYALEPLKERPYSSTFDNPMEQALQEAFCSLPPEAKLSFMSRSDFEPRTSRLGLLQSCRQVYEESIDIYMDQSPVICKCEAGRTLRLPNINGIDGDIIDAVNIVQDKRYKCLAIGTHPNFRTFDILKSCLQTRIGRSVNGLPTLSKLVLIFDLNLEYDRSANECIFRTFQQDLNMFEGMNIKNLDVHIVMSTDKAVSVRIFMPLARCLQQISVLKTATIKFAFGASNTIPSPSISIGMTVGGTAAIWYRAPNANVLPQPASVSPQTLDIANAIAAGLRSAAIRTPLPGRMDIYPRPAPVHVPKKNDLYPAAVLEEQASNEEAANLHAAKEKAAKEGTVLIKKPNSLCLFKK